MKKLIAIIALGAFVFTSTLVTTSFAADTETAETTKATTNTAENTATATAISAAQTEGAVWALAIPLTAATAMLIGAATTDSKTAHGAHGHGHGHGHGH